VGGSLIIEKTQKGWKLPMLTIAPLENPLSNSQQTSSVSRELVVEHHHH
jgi:hypothetical protein